MFMSKPLPKKLKRASGNPSFKQAGLLRRCLYSFIEQICKTADDADVKLNIGKHCRRNSFCTKVSKNLREIVYKLILSTNVTECGSEGFALTKQNLQRILFFVN